MFSSPLASRVSESLSSNPESPEPLDLKSRDDVEFKSKAYVEELLECGLKEDRFRIDRRKLEEMLQTQQNGNTIVEKAEDFFQRVMFETSTQISWPSKLKIGAKSKKDPHVKIIGKPECVQQAKEKILEILDTKKNRVTLKMDVSHMDHSYIIGKGGFKIQQVMEDTGCHIHFPDSNRTSISEKSNQVSIAGQAMGVEQARAKIREMLPVVFTFELPCIEMLNPGEECSPAVQHIQQTYSFKVSFRQLGIGRTLVVVRGCLKLLPRLRQGLSLLLEYLTCSESVTVMGFMRTEIAAQHHQFVMGQCNANIQMIAKKTGATLSFPDVNALHGDTLSPSIIAGHTILRTKSTVVIEGSFDSVCLAWQELLKCLPLVLMFDLKEGQELDPILMNNYMETFGISIMVRPKFKENTKSVLIRGVEKDSKILFQVRNEILQLDESDSYPASPIAKAYKVKSDNCSGFQTPPPSARDYQMPTMNMNMSAAESLSILTNIIQQNPQIVGLLNNLSSAFPQNAEAHAAQEPVFRNAAVPNGVPQIHLSPYQARNVESWIQNTDPNYAYTNGANAPHYIKKDQPDDADSGIFIPSRSRLFGGLDAKSDFSSRPPSSASSPEHTPEHKSGKRLEQAEKTPSLNQLVANYGNMKLAAGEMMQKPVEGVRTPNPLWSGLGFSKSMPDCSPQPKRAVGSTGSILDYLEVQRTGISKVEAAAAKAWNADSKDKRTVDRVHSPFTLSNFWENIPQQSTSSINYGSLKSLDQLLHLLDLEKYTELFADQEIDLSVFTTLTDTDLQQLRINFADRRKMQTAIAAIREQRRDWSRNFRAAPGAERRFRFSASSINDVN